MRAVFITVALLLMGCSSTHIVSEDRNAEIYLDQHMIGVGEAHVDRVGPPRTVRLEARRGGKVVGDASMARSFAWQTMLWGICSYYTGFYWGWYYPETVQIPLRTRPDEFHSESSGKPMSSEWADPRQSIWMRPLK